MKDSLPFVGRTKETNDLFAFYKQRKHVLLIGASGIGKTALLRHVRESCPCFLFEERSSLGRICDGIERQLGWTNARLNVIERKNRLLRFLSARAELAVFDHVAHAAPRVSRFIAALTKQVPVWIVCRSDKRDAIGHVWEHLYKFARIELRPFTRANTRNLINGAMANRAIQPDVREHANELHHLSGGNPRILQELLIELGAREYKMSRSSGRKLLALDRDIRELKLALQATSDQRFIR